MLKKNKKKLLLSSILILLPILAGLILWDSLPKQMATHWGMSGAADGWSGRALTVFVPPVLLLALHWICLLITAADPKNKNQSRKALDMIFWIIPGISLFSNGILYATALGMNFSILNLMFIAMGFTFILTGNYFPKCKQNNTLGIRIKWTLEDEENWNQTHRLGGKVWVVCGLLLIVTAFLPALFASCMSLALVLVVAVVPIAYSYLYHRKQVREGTLSPSGSQHRGGRSFGTKASAILTVVTLAAVSVLLFTGNIKVQYGDTAFAMEASYWKDLTIAYEDIEAMELRSQGVSGSRTLGFGSPRLQMGTFENEEFGSYTRYTYTTCDSCIVLTVNGQTIVINGADEEATGNLYGELAAKIK